MITTTGSDVAEILESYQSEYGYKTYNVRYLINPKLEEITEEWLPPQYMRLRLLSKKDVRSLPREKLGAILGPDGSDRLNSTSDSELYDMAKRKILELAERGNLKFLLQDPPK